MSIVGTVRAFLAGYDRAPGREGPAAGRPLVVAVSGGPDSVALLHLLARRGIYPPASLVVAHLNHRLRPEAAADASFVQDLAGRWGLVFRCGEADVGQLALEYGLSLEAAARQARYEFLAAVARDVGAPAVVTGHNQNDQAETVLMHILRGSGLTGLRGMRPVSSLPGAPDITLLRPLLTLERAQIETYCREHHLQVVEDLSNQDTALFRNRLRHELLPELAGYNPGIVNHLSYLAAIVEADEELLARLSAEAWAEIVTESGPGRLSFDRSLWRALPLAMRRRTLRQAVMLLAPEAAEIGFESAELARRVAEEGQTGDQASLPGGLLLELEYGRLVVRSPGLPVTAPAWPQLPDDNEHALPVPGRLQLPGGWALTAGRVGEIAYERIVANPDPWRAFISVAFDGQLRVRPRLTGETFRPLGMGGHSARVGDVMTNRKIPAALRDRWPVIACPEHLLWLVGHALDERARIRPDDQGVLLLRVERLPAVD